MIRIIEGRAGSGKSDAVFDEIKALAESGNKRIVLMVPKQFTALTERELVMRLGNMAADGIEVLSFDRLADFVLKKLGGAAEVRVTRQGRLIVMDRALEAVSDKLKIYKKSAAYVEFVQSLLEISDEFSDYCITPDALMRVRDRMPAALADKMDDLCLVFEMYRAMLKSEKDDSAAFEAALDKIKNSDIFRGYSFYFDSYSSFTPIQLQAVEALLPRLERVVFALTGDNLESADCEEHFAPSARTYRRIVRMAKSNNIDVETVNAGNRNVFAPEIRHTEQNLFSHPPKAFDGKAENVALIRGADTESEVVAVARDLLEKQRTMNLKFSDFALICRNEDDYKDVVERIFAKYEIPVFVSVKQPLINTPLALALLAAMRCAFSGFTYQNVFAYLKTGLSTLSDVEVCELESYVYTWGIKPARWTDGKPWTMHPDGYNREKNKSSEEKLKRINALRMRTVDEIMYIKRQKSDNDAQSISLAAYNFLKSISADKKLKEQEAKLRQSGRLDEAEKVSQQWNMLVSSLEQLAQYGGKGVGTARYIELLKTVFSTQDIATVPMVAEAVTFGEADRLRTARIKATYLLGCNEGVFPKMTFEENLISERERDTLAKADIMLAPNAEEKINDEKFLFYCAATSAERRLTLSYSESGIGKNKSGSSAEYKAMFKMFPDIVEATSQNDVGVAESKKAAFEYAVGSDSADLRLKKHLAKYFESNVDDAARLQAIADAADVSKRPKKLMDAYKVERLYSSKTLSPTRLETFARCEFAHFCQYGLKLKDSEKKHFALSDIGTFLHAVVEEYFKNHFRTPAEGRAEVVERLVNAYIVSNAADIEAQSERLKFIFHRMSRVVLACINAMENELFLSSFTPCAFELVIGENGDVKPFDLDGYSVIGKIDRVDSFYKDGVLYIKVVDYKSGVKEFSYSEAQYGIGLQMLLYLFTLCKNGGEKFGKNLVPAAVLYSPLRNDSVTVGRGTNLQKEKSEKHLPKGIVLDDETVLKALDNSQKYEFLPLKNDTDGVSAEQGISLITAERFSLLRKFTEAKLREIIGLISGGGIELNPIGDNSRMNNGKPKPCSYCKMAPICRIDNPDFVRSFEEIKADEFFGVLEGGGANGMV